MRSDQSRRTIYSSPKYATTGSDRAQRCLQTLQGQRYFIGLYLGDEATQTTRTNFSEHTLNPPTSPRRLSAEFEYTLYSVVLPVVRLQ
jgi:hypothetical protein